MERRSTSNALPSRLSARAHCVGLCAIESYPSHYLTHTGEDKDTCHLGEQLSRLYANPKHDGRDLPADMRVSRGNGGVSG